MTQQDITSLIKDLELQYKVDEWEIEGVPVWPLIRIENYYLLSLSLLSSEVSFNSKQTGYFFQLLKAFSKRVGFFFNKKNSKLFCNDVVFLSDGISFTKIDGKWFEKFCDPLAKEFEKKGMVTQRWDLSHSYLTPGFYSSKFIQLEVDLEIIKTKLKSKIRQPKFSSENWSDFDQFIKDDQVIKYFKKIPCRSSIRLRIEKIIALKKLYRNLLLKSNPKEAYIVSYYGDQQMAFILACKELGVTTFDLQHGVQGEFHLAYCNWLNVPNNGYSCLPDYFFVWSEYEKKVFEYTCSKDFLKMHQPIIKGNLFSDFWKNDNEKLVKDYDLKIKDANDNDNAPLVLLTLSPYTENLMDPIWETIKYTQNEFNWWIRLHPAMSNQRNEIVNLLKNKGIFKYNIEDACDYPLYAILRNAQVHVTVQSSTVIEAADFGVPSIITTDYGCDLYRNQVSSFYFSPTSEQIIKTINLIICN